MATVKKPASRKPKNSKPKAKKNDAASTLKRLQEKRNQNPDSCIFC
jgi:hypothetical protein